MIFPLHGGHSPLSPNQLIIPLVSTYIPQGKISLTLLIRVDFPFSPLLWKCSLLFHIIKHNYIFKKSMQLFNIYLLQWHCNLNELNLFSTLLSPLHSLTQLRAMFIVLGILLVVFFILITTWVNRIIVIIRKMGIMKITKYAITCQW